MHLDATRSQGRERNKKVGERKKKIRTKEQRRDDESKKVRK